MFDLQWTNTDLTGGSHTGPALSLSAAHRAASARSAGQAAPHSSSAHYLHHAQFEKPKMFQYQIRVCWSRQKKLLPHLRGVNTTRLIWRVLLLMWPQTDFCLISTSPIKILSQVLLDHRRNTFTALILRTSRSSVVWINCKLCVSELLSSCWAKVKKSRSAVTGSDWLSGRGPPCLLTAALEHAGVQSMWPTRPLSPLTSIKNMPKTLLFLYWDQ